jgi:large subunit ribosomal protein L3
MTEENKTKIEPVSNESQNMEKQSHETQNISAIEPFPVGFKFLLGKKIGMTQIFDSDGHLHSVSVVEAGPCRVVCTRTKEKHGYNAVCLGFEEMNKAKNIKHPVKGLFEKLNITPLKHLREFRVLTMEGIKEGQIADVKDRFAEGDYIDVHGISKGKGFAGGMKRHNFHGGPASHGASDKERGPGSLAGRRSLGRVLPGQRMAGHLGQEKVTVQKIKVLKIIPEKNLLFLGGSVPGANGSIVSVTAANKKIKIRPQAIAPKTGKKQAKPAAKKPAVAPAKK